jgi:transposase
MSERLKNVDRETAMLLPPDLREWIPEDDFVHFIIETCKRLNLTAFKLNRRGTGSEQYPPWMMLELLVYCYSQGILSSRKIERATYRDVAVRYLTGDTHPDHDTICTFRRENKELIEQAFVEVLRLAREMGLLKVGTISIDGTHVKANASKYRSVRYDRLKELDEKLREDIKELMEKAEAADKAGEQGHDRLPQEIARREVLSERISEAIQELENREKEREEDQADEESNDGPGTDGPQERGKKPDDRQQINLSDADSRLMRKSRRDNWEQAYNAQAAVDADGSYMIVGNYVTQSAGDKGELKKAVASVPEEAGTVKGVLADAGYASSKAIDELSEEGYDLYIAVGRGDNAEREYDFRPPSAQPQKKTKIRDETLLAMQAKVRSEEGKKMYARRKSTSEPVFGIIKQVIGLRQFLLRGLEKVSIEWNLACLAYNMGRVWRMQMAPPGQSSG